jgi:hypothetical protein
MQTSEEAPKAYESIDEIRRRYYPGFSPAKAEPVYRKGLDSSRMQMAAALMKDLQVKQ